MSKSRDLELEGERIADAVSCPTCGASRVQACRRGDGSSRPYWLVHYDRRLAYKDARIPRKP
jgi:hypothetical protein